MISNLSLRLINKYEQVVKIKYFKALSDKNSKMVYVIYAIYDSIL